MTTGCREMITNKLNIIKPPTLRYVFYKADHNKTYRVHIEFISEVLLQK